MTSKNISNALLRTLFILEGIVFLGYIIGVISSVLLYVIVAILLSFVAQPISDFLQKKLRLRGIETNQVHFRNDKYSIFKVKNNMF